MTNTIVTTVDGVGSVEAVNDLASFTLTVRVKNESLDQAKMQVSEKTAQITKYLEDLKGRATFKSDIGTTSLSYKLEHREGGERITAGFQVVNTITFSIVVDDNLNDVYKTCLKFDPQMSRPVFSMSGSELQLHLDKAIQNATDNAAAKLKKECALLGISIHDLRIQNWHFGYEGDLPALNFASSTKSVHSGGGVYGASTNYSATSIGMVNRRDADDLRAVSKLGTIHQELIDPKIEPGTETFTMAVRVNYVWDSEKTK